MIDSYIINIVKNALAEDLGTGDISSITNDNQVEAAVITNDNAVIYGIEYFQESFYQLNNNISIVWYVKDGAKIAKKTKLCTIYGNAKTILSAERVALNFLQTLSATATQTRYLVDKINNTKAKILDTRKTIPNLRYAQKQAVVAGGGVNHRMGLYDMIIIKENHIKTYKTLDIAIKTYKNKYPNTKIIVEIETIAQLKIALNYDITRILCDNFSPELLQQAVQITNNKIPLEASGNINEFNILKYAKTGVDYISIGSITKNISAIDLSLKIL